MKYSCHSVSPVTFGIFPSRALWLLLAIITATVSAPAIAAGEERVWVAGWRDTTPLNVPRAGAALVTAGDHVYAIGGIDGVRFLRSVEFARILPDGTLTPWQPTAPINEERGFFDAVIHQGYIYIAGGGNGDNGKNLLRSVERAPIGSDGRLGSWETMPVTLNYPRRCVNLTVTNDSLYAIGGFGGTLLDSVERAGFLPDGGLGAFELEPNTTTIPRYINAAVNDRDMIYVVGGHSETEGSGIADVEFTRAGAQNEPLVWQSAAPLSTGRYALSSALLGDRLYALGGLDGPVYVDSIETSTLGKDGVPGPWRATTALSSPRANFATFTHRGRLYVVGGTNRDGYFATVEYAERDEDGAIGFWASAREAAAHERRRAAADLLRAEDADLPNEGTVLEVVQTGLYSYVRVAGPHGEEWLAGPRGEFSVDDRVRYSSGMPMSNFESRSLGRTFERILFVEDIVRLER